MINEISYTYFINGEFLGLFSNIVTLSNESDPFLGKIKPQVDDLNTANIAAGKLYLPQKKSQQTENVVTEDATRDGLFTGFNKVVDGNTYHPDKNLANHAVTIQLCINKYGKDITKQSLVNETNTLNNLIEDLETEPKVKAAVAALGLEIWVTALKEANNKFNDTYLNRTKEVGEQIDGPLLPYRFAIQEKWEELEKYINANQLLTPLPSGETLINSINALIDQYTTTAKKRRSGKKNDLPTTLPTTEESL